MSSSNRYVYSNLLQESVLKSKFVSASLLSLMMLLPLSVFAKNKSTDVHLAQATQVGETTLQPGTYHVTVTPAASGNSVSFAQNGKQVASVTGQSVQLSKKSPNTSVTVDNSGKVPRIADIDFEGQQTAVGFNAATATANAGE